MRVCRLYVYLVTKMEKYELMLIIKPLLPDDMKNEVLKKIEKIISAHKGKVLETDIWGKRYLSYPIKKYDEGYYVIYKIEIKKENVVDLDKDLNFSGNILRMLRLKID